MEFDLGGLYEQSGDLDKARAHFAKVVALDPKFVEGQLALGRVDIKRGHAQDALAPLNTALTLAIQLNHDEVRANTLQAIGIAYKQLDRLDEALKNYQESLDIKQRLGNKRGMAGSLSEIAQVQERQGKLKEAEQSYQAALKFQREIGDKAGMSTTLINLAGLMNETLGRPDDALPLLREALQLRRDAGNPAGEAMVLNNIGNVYLAKGDYSEAQTYFERTLELREKANVRPKDLADTLHNLGETLSKEGRYDQALAQYLRAIDLRRNSGDKRGAAIESYSMGTVFDAQGRYGAAVKAKEEALQSFRELNQKDAWLAEILGGYGYSLSLAGRKDDAAKPLDEALSVARGIAESGARCPDAALSDGAALLCGRRQGRGHACGSGNRGGVQGVGQEPAACGTGHGRDDRRRRAADAGAGGAARETLAGRGCDWTAVDGGRVHGRASRRAPEARRSRRQPPRGRPRPGARRDARLPRPRGQGALPARRGHARQPATPRRNASTGSPCGY